MAEDGLELGNRARTVASEIREQMPLGVREPKL
jgi:hypothetical protein